MVFTGMVWDRYSLEVKIPKGGRNFNSGYRTPRPTAKIAMSPSLVDPPVVEYWYHDATEAPSQTDLYLEKKKQPMLIGEALDCTLQVNNRTQIPGDCLGRLHHLSGVSAQTADLGQP